MPLDVAHSTVAQMQFVIRARSDPRQIARGLRREIENAAPGNIVASGYSVQEIMTVAGQEILVGAAPLVPLIGIGMLLTAAGIYGVLAFAVTRRSREFAVRMAVGATRVELLRLVAAQSLRVIAVGTVCGVVATYALARLGRSTGGGANVFDPEWPAFIVPALIIVVTGAVATWVPSRRALKISPATLLRHS